MTWSYRFARRFAIEHDVLKDFAIARDADGADELFTEHIESSRLLGGFGSGVGIVEFTGGAVRR